MRLVRGAAAFLLAAHAVAHVEMHFWGAPSRLALLLVIAAALLGLMGEGPARETPTRDRAQVYRVGGLWALYAMTLSGALILSMTREEDILGALIRMLLLAELLFLGWPAIGPRGVPLLMNSLALCTLSALSGGLTALSAVGGHAPLAAAFLVADHHERMRAPVSWALPPMFGHALVAALVTWPLLALLPAARTAGRGFAVDRSALLDGLSELALWALFGLALMLAAGRLLEHLRGKPAELLEEEQESSARGGPPVERPGRFHEPDPELSGARESIVRTFESFLLRCRRLGYERRPSSTAVEFARSLPAPALRLARLFSRARYSVDPLSSDDAAAAAADAATVLERLRGNGGRYRPATASNQRASSSLNVAP